MISGLLCRIFKKKYITVEDIVLMIRNNIIESIGILIFMGMPLFTVWFGYECIYGRYMGVEECHCILGVCTIISLVIISVYSMFIYEAIKDIKVVTCPRYEEEKKQ